MPERIVVCNTSPLFYLHFFGKHMRTYPQEVVQIVEDARAEHAELKKQGYSREDALADFREFRRELSRRSASPDEAPDRGGSFE